MSYLSNFLAHPQPTLTAAATISSGQLIEVGPDGKAFPATVSDYAAVGNAGTAILAATSLTTGYPLSYGNNSPLLMDSDGSLFCAVGYSGSTNGLTVKKFTSSGSLVNSANIDTVISALYAACLIPLSNGCIATIHGSTSGYYSILDQNLNQVVAKTGLNGANSNSAYPVGCPLSGGGFAAFYRTAAGTARLAIYNNSGTYQAGANITVSSSRTFDLSICQLSNGNIALGFSSGSAQFQFAIYDTSAVQQVAPTNAITGAGSNDYTKTSAISGYFALAVSSNGAAHACAAVFNNAGAAQGSTYVGGGNSDHGFGLTNDGSNFWFGWHDASTNYNIYMTKITNLGVSTEYQVGPLSGNYSYCGYGNCDNSGRIPFIGAYPGNSVQYAVFSTKSATWEISPTTISTSTTGNDGVPSVVSLGDCSFGVLGGVASTNIAYLSLWKAVNTAVLGVSSASVSAGDKVPVDCSSGWKTITPLVGSPSKSFDFTSTNIYGNKGSIAGTGVSLQGM